MRRQLVGVGSTIAAMLLASGCSPEGGPTTPVSVGPAFNVTPGPGLGLYLCKIGPVGTNATFTITATGGTVVFPSVTLQARDHNECVSQSQVDQGLFTGPVNQILIWSPDPNVDPNLVFNVTVTETGASPGVHLALIYSLTGLSGEVDIFPPQTFITIPVSYNAGGGIIAFENEGAPPPPQFCSYTPGGWGAPPSGGNIATLLTARFGTVYPTGVSVGASGNYHASFSSAGAVTTYLPQGGTPGWLTHNYTNPTAKTEAGEFLDQVLALRFNVNFSAAGLIKPGFSTATVQGGPLAGLTTTQVLALANAALGGNLSGLTPYGLTVKTLTTILGNLNGNYDNCTANNGFLN